MKKITLALAAFGMTVASPAFALKVTNLDTVAHRIVFDSAGSQKTLTLAPDESQYITGSPAGRLSLAGAGKAGKGSAVETQGILRNYIGNGRNQDVPADPDDQFVIWPGGDLVLQRHIRQQGKH